MHISNIALFLILLLPTRLCGQADLDPPVPPVLQLVSVDQATGNVEITWSVSPSQDVTGYVVYLYFNNEGHELDTIYNPAATNYLRTNSGSVYYSESFVVAALDTAGNISPLSNMLSTVYTSVLIDTCNKRVEVSWNSYSPVPIEVTGYSLYYSVNGGSFTDSITAGPGITNLGLDNFTIDARYCFFVRASLSGGLQTGSNKACIQTEMQRPPEWINADYASVATENDIMLSFTPDPSSETRHYILEKKTRSDEQFSPIYDFTNITGRTLYVDSEADVSEVNQYRLKAINNCNKAVTWSNIASNIVLAANQNEENIELSWNPYRSWRGVIDSNLVYIKTGKELERRYLLPSKDSSLIIPYSNLMYEASLNEICFMIRAVEASNPYNVNGVSKSQITCIPVIEKITVPNVFTPDNNSVNDLFKPVLSFSPSSYRLVITDMKRRTLFETTDFMESWDGTRSGVPQPEGVYLWYMSAGTPSGREIVKTGTVTIIHNR